MRSFALGLVLCTCVVPLVSHAAINAGAVTGIWFSDDLVVEQTPVDIIAAIQNESTGTIAGTLQFFVDGNAIGTTTFSTPPAKITRLSLPYTFTSGVHSVSGRIGSVDGDISLSYEHLAAQSITVAEKPPPPVLLRGGNGSSFSSGVSAITQTGSGIIASINPVAGSLAQGLESARNGVVQSPGSPNGAIGMTMRAKNTTNLFDLSVEIAQSNNLPLWRRGLAIFLGLCAWLVRQWLWVVIIALLLFMWHTFHK